MDPPTCYRAQQKGHTEIPIFTQNHRKTFWNTVVAGLLHTVVQKLLHFKRPRGIIKTFLQNISFSILQCVNLVKYWINKSHNFVESGMQESKKPRN